VRPLDAPQVSAPTHEPLALPNIEGVPQMKALKTFVVREEGQDLVEYALLAALLSVVSIVILTTLGKSISVIWEKINTALQ
jgi:Flp pilus assembly pilin Flp